MAQFNSFNQPSNSNFENNQSQERNPNLGMNQGNNQNSNLNNGYNQGQNRSPFGNMNQRQNINRNQYQNQNQSQGQNQTQNQYQNQGQNRASSQNGRNQRNPFGFNRFGNSYSNYYSNTNNESNQGTISETSNPNNEPQVNEKEIKTTVNEPQSRNNEPRTSGNSRYRSYYQPNNESEISNKNNVEEYPNNIKQNSNIDQTISEKTNDDTNTHDYNNDNSNHNVTSSNQNDNSIENNQSSDENSNTKPMSNHNNELNAASIKNSFEVNDGGTPVIKLGGQYGFNLEKKMNSEHSIGKQVHESSNVGRDETLKISSVAERRHSYTKLYCSEKPYPNIEVSGENQDYAVYLLDDYASSLSELTAITSYVFLNLILDDKYQDIKDTYRGISIVEMHHLNLLGELIKKLGVLPRYYAKEANKITMWNSNFVSADIDMKTTLLQSIKNEEAGIIQYQKHIELIDDENIKVILARIILDEEVHVSLLKELYNKYCPEDIV